MFNTHLNPRLYSYAPRVKFHIQNENDIEGVAMCGGIYPRERYMVFTPQFVSSFDELNQCLCCMKEQADKEFRQSAECVSGH